MQRLVQRSLPSVVPPAHAGLVQQVRDVGPRVERALGAVALLVDHRPQGEVRFAAHRVVRVLAKRRPGRHEEQVRRERPRVGRREEPVLQHEVLCPRPVVGDLAGVVVAHDVGLRERAIVLAAVRCRPVDGRTLVPGGDDRADEAVHPSAVHVLVRGRLLVRTAVVPESAVVIRPGAGAGHGIRDARREVPVLRGVAVRTGEGAEVVIEGAVLLHDDDHVLDRVQATRGRRRRARRGGDGRSRLGRACGAATARAGGKHDEDEEHRGAPDAAPAPMTAPHDASHARHNTRLSRGRRASRARPQRCAPRS